MDIFKIGDEVPNLINIAGFIYTKGFSHDESTTLKANQFTEDGYVYTLQPPIKINPNNFLTSNGEAMDKPFSLGGYKAWCNGRSLLLKLTNKDLPSRDLVCNSLVEGIETFDYQSIPATNLEKVVCLSCDGKGWKRPTKECPECKTEGTVEVYHSFEEDCLCSENKCPDCRGTKKVEKQSIYDVTCQTCDGEGSVDDSEKDFVYCSTCNGSASMYEGKVISVLANESIALYPESFDAVCPWSDNLLVHVDKERNMLFFKKDGYYGLIMGVK